MWSPSSLGRTGSCYQPGRCCQEPPKSRTSRGGSAPAKARQAQDDLPAPEAPSRGGCPGSGPDGTRPVPQSKRRAAGPPEATPSSPPPQKLLAGSAPGAARCGRQSTKASRPRQAGPHCAQRQAQTPWGHPGRRTPAPATSRQSGPSSHANTQQAPLPSGQDPWGGQDQGERPAQAGGCTEQLRKQGTVLGRGPTPALPPTSDVTLCLSPLGLHPL